MLRPLFCFVFPFVDPPYWQRRVGLLYIYRMEFTYYTLLHLRLLSPPLRKHRFQQFLYCWVTSLSVRTTQKTSFLCCVCNRWWVVYSAVTIVSSVIVTIFHYRINVI
jgi:hypothetical protein